MSLPDLNARWQETGHPYAVLAEQDRYLWCCPRCESGGEDQVSLMEAMNDALVHKNYCPAIVE